MTHFGGILHDTFMENGNVYHLFKCSFCDAEFKHHGFANDIINDHVNDFASEEQWYQAKKNYVGGSADGPYVITTDNLDTEWVKRYDTQPTVHGWYTLIVTDVGWCGYTKLMTPIDGDKIMCRECFNAHKGIILTLH